MEPDSLRSEGAFTWKEVGGVSRGWCVLPGGCGLAPLGFRLMSESCKIPVRVRDLSCEVLPGGIFSLVFLGRARV